MNVNWIGPTLMKYGTEEQKEQHINGMAGGTVVWCQGFSEPDAGTDLAALKTRADNRGDHYLINGSKIWTSYARQADWCFLLARTGQGRKEISIFLIPMDTPGILVNSFDGLPKFGHLNEVFFTDVKVSTANRVGEEGAAWEIITYALGLERLGVPRYHTGLDALDRAVAQLKSEGLFSDPIVRSRAGMIASKFEAARALTYLAVDQRARLQPPTMDANIARISALEAVTELMNFLIEFLPDCIAGGDPLLEDYYRVNVPANITAGTYELQLNLIARNALGLPKE
jgi:alkylation response protein AidB-like acyl-CoA dehydrogenase